jgi:hypothetical protein
MTKGQVLYKPYVETELGAGGIIQITARTIEYKFVKWDTKASHDRDYYPNKMIVEDSATGERFWGDKSNFFNSQSEALDAIAKSVANTINISYQVEKF